MPYLPYLGKSGHRFWRKECRARILKKLQILEETQVHLGSQNSQKQPIEKKNAKESEMGTTFFALVSQQKKEAIHSFYCFFCWDPRPTWPAEPENLGRPRSRFEEVCANAPYSMHGS